MFRIISFSTLLTLALALSACSPSERTISFAENTSIPFCISMDAAEISVKAAGEENYFAALNRLSSLESERLCTPRLSMENVPELKVRPELLEVDEENGRTFMIASIPRNAFNTCDACDALRSSERLFFITYNELGDTQFGWKGYVQYIVNNRTVGGIFDFLFN